jgi:hypothetical protein
LIRHREYTRARLAQTSARLRAAVRPETRPLQELAVAGPAGRIRREEALGLDYRPAGLGGRLEPLFATFWLRGAAVVPTEWARSRVDLLWDSASEATLWLGRAEASDAVVLRLYGARGVARLRPALAFAEARLANALEDEGEALEVEGDEIVVPYAPHQILTVVAR